MLATQYRSALAFGIIINHTGSMLVEHAGLHGRSFSIPTAKQKTPGLVDLKSVTNDNVARLHVICRVHEISLKIHVFSLS